MFTKNDKKRLELNKNIKCSQCRRTITPHSNYSVINGKPYCEKCAKKKKDWDFMFLMDLLDDE